MKIILMCGLSVLLIFGCIDSGVDSSSDRDAGSGTNTLYVDAHIEGEPGDSTHMEVEVRLDGNLLSGATVLVDSDQGQITLSETSSGYYEIHQSGYAPRYTLTVEFEDHNLEGSLDSPKPHTLQNPAPGSTYDTQSGDLEVNWSPTGADETRVRSDEADLDFSGDPGQATIPGTAFQDDDDEIEVERTNRVHLAGGVGDSHLEISYEVKVEIFVENPYEN